MRRKEKEITDKNLIEKILNEAETINIAMIDGDEPYIVALNYVYTSGCLYMHCAKEGRKIDILRKNNKVAFEVYKDVEIVLKEEAHNCTTKYLSVVGSGRASLIDDAQEKKRLLDALMTKHTGKISFDYPERVLNMTLIIKIDIDHITGKNSGY